MPKRHSAVDSYRYGFQGQEKDDEIKGEGNSINFKYRMHDPRVNRFFAVDPLVYKYPYWSPYVFSGNRLINSSELEGQEPDKNPKVPGKSEKLGMTAVANIVYNSVQNTNRINGPLTRNQVILKGEYIDNGTTGFLNVKDYNGISYITDTATSSAETFNMYVDNTQSYMVDESNSKDYKNYEAYVVGAIMYNFLNGSGPENYVFPDNGIISSKFKESDIVKAAITNYKNTGNGKTAQYSFGVTDLAKDAIRNDSFFSITGLVGSGTITMTPKDDGLHIQIFNVTSLTSGSLGKELFEVKNYPKSYVRSGENTTPFGNISQTFSFTIKYEDLKITKPIPNLNNINSDERSESIKEKDNTSVKQPKTKF